VRLYPLVRINSLEASGLTASSTAWPVFKSGNVGIGMSGRKLEPGAAVGVICWPVGSISPTNSCVGPRWSCAIAGAIAPTSTRAIAVAAKAWAKPRSRRVIAAASLLVFDSIV
jgi:hypothetical protein